MTAAVELLYNFYFYLQINDFISKNTNDKIQDLVEDTVDSLTRMVVVSAVYFKGKSNPVPNIDCD